MHITPFFFAFFFIFP
ncbi:pheA operon leader peptide PheL [Acerihabitans sp.]